MPVADESVLQSEGENMDRIETLGELIDETRRPDGHGNGRKLDEWNASADGIGMLIQLAVALT